MVDGRGKKFKEELDQTEDLIRRPYSTEAPQMRSSLTAQIFLSMRDQNKK